MKQKKSIIPANASWQKLTVGWRGAKVPPRNYENTKLPIFRPFAGAIFPRAVPAVFVFDSLFCKTFCIRQLLAAIFITLRRVSLLVAFYFSQSISTIRSSSCVVCCFTTRTTKLKFPVIRESALSPFPRDVKHVLWRSRESGKHNAAEPVTLSNIEKVQPSRRASP